MTFKEFTRRPWSALREPLSGVSLRSAFDVSVNVFLVITCATLLWKPSTASSRSTLDERKRALPAQPIPLNEADLLGSPLAPAAVIEYSDFQCPYCKTFTVEVLPKLKAEYVHTGKALFAFRQFPLERIHPLAVKAAEAAECAGRQGKFWEMHDALFLNPRDLGAKSVRRRAEDLKLHNRTFEACLTGGEATDSVRRDLAGGKELKITGTPTFLIGRLRRDGKVDVVEMLSGAQPFERFETALRKVLNAP